MEMMFQKPVLWLQLTPKIAKQHFLLFKKPNFLIKMRSILETNIMLLILFSFILFEFIECQGWEDGYVLLNILDKLSKILFVMRKETRLFFFL